MYEVALTTSTLPFRSTILPRLAVTVPAFVH